MTLEHLRNHSIRPRFRFWIHARMAYLRIGQHEWLLRTGQH